MTVCVCFCFVLISILNIDKPIETENSVCIWLGLEVARVENYYRVWLGMRNMFWN